MARKRKPGVNPKVPGYTTVGRIKKYQLDPRWDEMTADQRAAFEDGRKEDDDLSHYCDDYEQEYDDYSEDSGA